MPPSPSLPVTWEEPRSELVLGKRDWKYGQTCFVTTTVNRRNTFCCVKWVPLLISSFLRKAKKSIWNLFTVVVKKHFGKLSVPLLVPDAFSRTRTVVDIRFAIACDCMRSHAIPCDRIEWDRCDIAHKRLSACLQVGTISDYRTPKSQPENPRLAWGIYVRTHVYRLKTQIGVA